ncbi:MAG: hypothetical protein HYZ84_03190, partial [Candidatus Omnitrophica bacterium]|nr:hypothetical protein [Candidatus Omnitrophota bacterium]
MRKPRVTAVLTAVIFLLTNTGWANPVTESLPAAVPIKFKTEDFRIPENLGTVQELYHPEAQNS